MSAQGYRMISINGRKVAEHIYIMEKILGRKMKGRGKEVIHHIDHNKLNNDPKNLLLMKMSDHQIYHQKQRQLLNLLPSDADSKHASHQFSLPNK